jgi:murein DD-endopeptidase MepM/ murein hydrolase activator NlpD
MRALLIVAVALSVLAPALAGAQLRLVTLDIRVPKAPAAAISGGLAHFVYELRMTNVGRRDLALQRLEVSTGAGSPTVWEGDSLKKVALRMGETGDGRAVPAGRQSLFYLLVSAPAGTPVTSLGHRFLFTHPDSLTGPARDTLSGFQVAVDTRPIPVLQAPFKGGPWLAANGPGNSSGHRTTVIPLNGVGRIAQRFATDWIKLGADGKLWQGDSTKNESWYGYREPLFAVGAGTVVAMKDSISENVPLAPNRAVPITLETVGGNHVILDLGEGHYALYAHLVPGSIRVKLGDKVKVGQPIGLLGNSGNSDAPHLHLHLGDAPSPLGTEGIPFLFDHYWVLGRAGDLDLAAAWKPAGPETVERKALPFENQIVRFDR